MLESISVLTLEYFSPPPPRNILAKFSLADCLVPSNRSAEAPAVTGMLARKSPVIVPSLKTRSGERGEGRLGLVFLPQPRRHQSHHCHLVKVSLILSQDVLGRRHVCENVLNMRVSAHHPQHRRAVQSIGCFVDQSEMYRDVFIEGFKSFIIDDWLEILYYDIELGAGVRR